MILVIDQVHAMMSKSWHLVVLEFKYHYTSILLACPARLYPICVRSDGVTGFSGRLKMSLEKKKIERHPKS